MSKDSEEYRKARQEYLRASNESTYAGLRALKEQAEARLRRNNGNALAKHILSSDKNRD